MQTKFQLLDCDYILNGSTPIIRMFGKNDAGKSVCAFYRGVKPYFYVQVKGEPTGNGMSKKEAIERNHKALDEFLKNTFPGVYSEMIVVNKYLPIGYRQKKDVLAKIILTDPSKVPEVRDDLKKLNFVKEIFEADIPFKYRFMVDHGLSGMSKVMVEGTAIKTKTVKTKIKIDVTKVDPIQEDNIPRLRHMAVDIEIASTREGLPDSRRDSIAMISMAFDPTYDGKNSIVLMVKHLSENGDPSVKTFLSEADMLKEFSRIVEDFDPDTIIGYNINGFDLPYIIERYRQNKMFPSFGRCGSKQARVRTFGNMNRSDVTGRVVVDVYEIIKESARIGLMKLKRYGLGDVSKALLGEDKVDIAHSEIVKYWNGDSEMVKKLIDYSRKDSVLALKLLNDRSLMDKFIQLSRVTGVLLQDSLSSGEATRIETYLLREFNVRDFVVPCKPSGAEMSRRNAGRDEFSLKGAIVLEPKSGLHTKSVVYMDFKSMYPSIYISYNICPTTILDKDSELEGMDTPYGVRFVAKSVRRGIIPQIVERLINERDTVKRQMKIEEDAEKRREMNAKQLALKITANAFYGYTGYIRAKLYVLDIANAITSCGRHLITKTRDVVDSDDRFEVIYGDTDSVMVKTQTEDLEEAYRLGQELEIVINEALENVVKMKIESVFKTILILTKKRYAAWSFEKRGEDWEEKIVMKGIETVRRDWCDLVSTTLYRVLEIILKEQDPKKAFNYVRDILKKLQNNEIPIESLLITKSVSKPLHTYKGIQPHIELVKKMRQRNPTDAPGVGDRVGFVIVQGLQLLSNRAEDPDYIKERNLKIDSKYYIENQLIPPLERVFDAMNIDKSELLGLGKQTSLSSILGSNRSSVAGPQLSKSDKNSDTPLEKIEGVICQKCSRPYRRPPLTGKCTKCGGGFSFFNGIEKSNSCVL